MQKRLKIGLTFIIILLLFIHGLLLFLFFGPIQTVLHFAGLNTPNFVSIEAMSPAVGRTFNFVEGSMDLSLPEGGGGWQSLNQVILKGRYGRMDEQERHHLTLNTLPFGADVFGLQAGALYYFQKPLDQLTQEQVIHLAAFFRIFED